MARRTKAEIALERRHDELFKEHGSNVQFDMMDLGTMHNEWLAKVAAGTDDVEAMKEVVQKYRKN